jgi:hypothetical protein
VTLAELSVIVVGMLAIDSELSPGSGPRPIAPVLAVIEASAPAAGLAALAAAAEFEVVLARGGV